MSARRDFLKNAALASAALAVKPLLDIDFETSEKGKKPIVLSTWDFGLKANEGAWKILNSGGRALDAVESGVKITEADPNERSVGYGGRPDRDGRVILVVFLATIFTNCAFWLLNGILIVPADFSMSRAETFATDLNCLLSLETRISTPVGK